MTYSKQTWVDSNPSYPLSAPRLQHIEDGIAAVDINKVSNGDLEFNVLSYYSGSGSHDAALAAASAAAGVAGGVVRIPSNITITAQYTQPTGVRLRGPAIMGAGSRPGAVIRANIVGGGAAIKAATGAGSLAIEGLAIIGGTGFTGVLIDYSAVSISEISHSLLQMNNSAADILYLDQALYHTSYKVNYVGGNVQVTGKATNGSFSNAVAFRDCRFGNGATCHVKNAGEAWVFEGGAVEYIDNGAAGFYRHDTGVRAKNMTIRNMWMGDITATPNGGTQIVWSGDNLTIEGSMLGWNDGTLLQVDENNCNGITLINNRYNAFHTNAPTTAVDFGATTGHTGFVFLSPMFHTPLTQVLNGSIPTGSIVDTGSGLALPPLGSTTKTNLLSDNDAQLTTSIAGWVAFDASKNSVARSTSVKFGADAASLISTTNVAGPQDIRVQQATPLGSVPAAAGQLYTFGVTMLALDATRVADMIIQWYDASGAAITPFSSVSSSSPYFIPSLTLTKGVAKQLVFPNALVPAGVSYARITPRVYATLNTERFVMGRFFAVSGYAAGWSGRYGNTVTVNGNVLQQNSPDADASLLLASKGASAIGLNTDPGTGTGGVVVGDGTGTARGSIYARKWVHTESTNDTQGVATLVAGTVTVSTTALLAGDRIRLTGQNSGAGAATWGALTVSAQTAGTSFVISSSLNTDTRSVLWEIVGVG